MRRIWIGLLTPVIAVLGFQGVSSAAVTTASAPASCTATQVAGGFHVTWTAPTSTGGSAITGYRINELNFPDPAIKVGATGRAVTWTRALVDSAPRFSIKALNAAGMSLPCRAVVGSTTAPSPVPTTTTMPKPTGGIAFGISTHTHWNSSPQYGNEQKTLDLTVRTKAAYIRDLLAINVSGQDALWRKYKAAGLEGVHATVGVYGKSNDKAKTAARLAQSADLLHEVSGWNEPDAHSVPMSTWLPTTAAWQKWLYTTVKSNPKTAHIKVGLGALRGANHNGAAETQALMRATTGYFDFVDLHVYPGPNRDVSSELDEHIRWAAGARQVVISEYGGSTANMTWAEQARVIREGLVHLQTRGITAYVYELWDDPDATGNDLQSNFGLYESDGSAKPAVAELQKLAGS